MTPRAARTLRALLLAALGLAALPAVADALLLPEAENAEPIEGPTLRVDVTAEGRIEQGGKTVTPPRGDILVPDLAEPLRAFLAEAPDGAVLVAGDRRADFRAVRAVLASANKAGLARFALLAAGPTPRAIRVQQSVSHDPVPEPKGVASLPPLAIHLRGDRLVLTRRIDAQVKLPRVDGRFDLDALSALLDEDRRLHPTSEVVILNTDDGVPYADTFAVLDRTRGKGYDRTLLAGGPPFGPDGPAPAPPALDAPLLVYPGVRLNPSGDIDLRAADGTVSPLYHDDTLHFEAHCDASTCDLVARKGSRRAYLGSRPKDVPFADTIFGRRVYPYTGRLGLPEPAREGVFSPLIQLKGEDAPGPMNPTRGGDPILLGRLPKEEIDAVIKKDMGKIRWCYLTLQAREPTVRGKVTVKFVIAADGSVSSAAFKQTDIEDPAFKVCLVNTFRALTFPEPEGNGIVIVSYPFIFAPG